MVNTGQLPASFTDDDLAAVHRALVDSVAGPQKVRFADGREVTYRTADELLGVQRLIQQQLQQNRRTGGIFARSTRATFVRD